MEDWRRNLYLVWVCQIIAVMGFNLSMPFLPFFLSELGVNDPEQLKSWVGWLSAAPPLGMVISAPIWGLLSDRFGYKPMLLRALFSGSIIIAIISLVSNPWQLFGLRVLQGVFTGSVAAATTLVAVGTPRRHSGMALGMLGTAQYIGSTIGPLFGGFAADLLGFRHTFWVSSIVVGLSGAVVAVKVKELKGGDVQLPAVDNPVSKRLRWQRTVLWLILSYLAIQMARLALIPYLPLLVIDLRSGLAKGSAAISGILLALMGISATLGGILMGRWFGHRQHRLRLALLLSLALFALQLWQLRLSYNFLGLTIGMVLISFLMNGVSPIINSCIVYVTPLKKRGFVFGLAAQARAVGWIVAAVGGSFITVSFSLRAIFVMSAAAAILAVPFILLARRSNPTL